MNKKVVVAVILVLLLLLGGWYFMKQPKLKSDSNPSNDDQQTENSTSLKDLLTKGTAQTCTYSSDGGGGKVYVGDGGKMRGDFETQIEDKAMMSHMIVKDNTSYIWTDGQKTGFKMAFDPNSVDTSTTTNTTVKTQAADLTANYNYKCSVWSVDASVFTPPSDVTFSTFELPSMESQIAPGSAGSGSASQCSYCNALSGDDKAQCLKALNCN